MKIVVLHGEDELKSRNRYFQIIDTLKKRGWEHIPLNPNQKISEQLVGSSLFDTERLYSCDKPQKISTKDYEWVRDHAKDHTGSFLLYFDKNIPATIKKLLPKDSTYEEFKIPKNLYVFLESIYPGNGRNQVRLFHEVIKTDPAELVLAMLARHLRDLYSLKVSPNDASYPDWRKRKLSSQLSRFKESSLENFIKELSEIDVKSKSGGGDLTMLLDLALLKL